MEVLYADIESPGVLYSVASRVAPAREITILFTAGDVISLRMTNIALLQMRTFDSPVLVITARAKHCETLNTTACAWSSRVLKHAPARSVSLDKFWDGRFRFYAAKKSYLAQLTRLGFSVFQADSDAIWMRDPWPVFRRLPEACRITVQADGPIANAGMIFTRPGSSASQMLLDDVAWRIQVFQNRPSIIAEVVKFAREPFYANSDDQSILNDAIQSAVLGAPRFLGSQARFEAKSRHNPYATLDWGSRPESAMWHADLSNTWKRSQRLHFASSGRTHTLVAFPLHADPSSAVCIAPKWLVGHMPVQTKQYITHLARARGLLAKLQAMCQNNISMACHTPQQLTTKSAG